MKKNFNFLKELLLIPSPSSFEEKISDLIEKNIASDEISFSRSTYGNFMAFLQGNKSGIVNLIAHMDEVGLMVKYIDSDGFIWVDSIGGIDPIVYVSQYVSILSLNGEVDGVVGATAIHLKEDESAPDLTDLFIDIGAKDKEEAASMVSVGDPIVIKPNIIEMPNNLICSRALDDKIGVFVVSKVLDRLSKLKVDKPAVNGVYTIGEENGCWGAAMASGDANMPYATNVVIDVTHGIDTPGLSPEKHGEVNLGEGVCISIGGLVHKRTARSLIKCAEENKIKHQILAEPGYGGNDADVTFSRKGGMPTVVLSIPNRYMHTSVEVVSLDDVNSCVDLLVKWIENI